MPRILGVDIPNNKKLAYSLRYIHGIGPKRADLVLQETGIDPDMRAKDLNEEQINAIMAKINELNYLVEGDLRRDLAANMKRSGDQLLPWIASLSRSSGQRTADQTNARTRKGKSASVGGLRK